VNTTFLLSPARCDGKRGRMLRRDASRIPIARQLGDPDGAPIGDVFAFISGLYFRGKLAYARAFAPASAFVITPSRGLLPIEHPITRDILEEFACCDIDAGNAAYRRPLERDVANLAAATALAATATLVPHPIVLLGSIASDKYVDVLLSHFGDRLFFPATFVGRGDMSRGGVMLRAVDAGQELAYARVAGAERRGSRPPKLPKLTRPLARSAAARIDR
jgi:hypothetical protein